MESAEGSSRRLLLGGGCFSGHGGHPTCFRSLMLSSRARPGSCAGLQIPLEGPEKASLPGQRELTGRLDVTAPVSSGPQASHPRGPAAPPNHPRSPFSLAYGVHAEVSGVGGASPGRVSCRRADTPWKLPVAWFNEFIDWILRGWSEGQH